MSVCQLIVTLYNLVLLAVTGELGTASSWQFFQTFLNLVTHVTLVPQSCQAMIAVLWVLLEVQQAA